MAIQVRKWRPRGPVLFASRDETKTPAAPKVFGESHCVDQITLSMNIDYLTHKAKCTAVDAEDARDIKEASGTVQFDFSNFTREALLMALAATDLDAEAAPATETDEVLPAVEEGDTVILGGAHPNFNITALSIEDSGSPANSLDEWDPDAETGDYILDEKFGMVEFKDMTGFVMPLKATYTHQNPGVFAALAAGRLVRWARFKGTNYVDSNRLVAVDMFKLQFSPASGFDLLPDDYGKLSLNAAVQIDLSRESDDPLGQFYSAAVS